MIALFALFGALCLIGIVAAVVLWWLDVPERSQRLRLEREAQEAAWRIQQRATVAFGQMLDAARSTQPPEERP